MKRFAFIAYTIGCLVVGGLLFHGLSYAYGQFSTQYYRVYETGAPAGYKATFGVSFQNGVKKENVIIDWKSDENFAVYIQ